MQALSTVVVLVETKWGAGTSEKKTLLKARVMLGGPVGAKLYPFPSSLRAHPPW
jgi:hypothetical protein